MGYSTCAQIRRKPYRCWTDFAVLDITKVSPGGSPVVELVTLLVIGTHYTLVKRLKTCCIASKQHAKYQSIYKKCQSY